MTENSSGSAASRDTPEAALGIDLGGTKIEAVLLAPDGRMVWRERVASPSADYGRLIEAVAGLVEQGRSAARATALMDRPSIGLGIPGTALPDGRIKNANTRCLNGRPMAADLAARLGQPVRLANDANCLALSEATDGAGAGADVVFAAILGTGTGAGIAVRGHVLTGPNGVAGEWGHNPLPWAGPHEPGPPCYCGQRGCLETWLSGPGMALDHARLRAAAHNDEAAQGTSPSAQQIAQAAAAGDPAAIATVERWQHRLARGLASVINLLDPDVIVLGGGLSRIASTYAAVPRLWGQWVVSGGTPSAVRTRLAPAQHGDASGVRGAAWLWRDASLDRP
jgi:fructokinase